MNLLNFLIRLELLLVLDHFKSLQSILMQFIDYSASLI